MGVIAFQKPKDKEVCEEHMTGIAVCAACNHEWIESAPVGATFFYCPVCKTHKGRMKYDCMPDSGVLWQCGCGCDLFRITGRGTMCINCGKNQIF